LPSSLSARVRRGTDATTVTKLYDAGAVLLGKLATHEFAHGGPSFEHVLPIILT
jgi:Asp-tRNA(Asn)/Glu-tRNA(Gln) amidotransferase A subunit family amidase